MVEHVPESSGLYPVTGKANRVNSGETRGNANNPEPIPLKVLQRKILAGRCRDYPFIGVLSDNMSERSRPTPTVKFVMAGDDIVQMEEHGVGGSSPPLGTMNEVN